MPAQGKLTPGSTSSDFEEEWDEPSKVLVQIVEASSETPSV